MSFDCPNCKSDNTMSFPMIFQSGTNTGSSKTIGYGLNTGLMGFGTKSKSQSLLAKSVKPPTKPNVSTESFLWTAVAIAFGAVVAVTSSIVVGKFGNLLGIVCGLGLFALVMTKLGTKTDKLNEQFNYQYAMWENSWQCLKCGHSWSVL